MAMKVLFEPESRFYQSQGLRLHYADWGNEAAPPLILIHGGADQCRSWDGVAQALQPHFHVMAPDMRGHGDSEWAKASSYSLSDYVYDLTRLIRSAALAHVPAIVAHSMGGMIGLAYAGTFPDRVSRLAVLDGMFLPGAPAKPIDQQMAEWIAQLDKLAERKVRSFRSIAEAAERILQRNTRLTQEQALHLATHGVRKNADGSLSWKFDPYQGARAPYRLSADHYAALWSRVTCPTLLLRGSESFLPDPAASGLLAHIGQADLRTITGAGHWLHHDKLDDVLLALRSFLGISGGT
jgi:pimeloyl-ACP methyl ester carboxylesterase